MPAPSETVHLKMSSQPHGYKNSHNSSVGLSASPTTQSATSPQEAQAEHPAARGGSTAQPASTAPPLVTVTPICCLTPRKTSNFILSGCWIFFFFQGRQLKQKTQADRSAGDTSPRLTHSGQRRRTPSTLKSPWPRRRPKQHSPEPRSPRASGPAGPGGPGSAAPGPFLPSASGSSGVTWYRPTASALPRATPLPEPPHAVPPPPPLPSDLGMRENFFMASGAPGRTGKEPEAKGGEEVPHFTCRPRHPLLLARRRLLKGRRRKQEEGEGGGSRRKEEEAAAAAPGGRGG